MKGLAILLIMTAMALLGGGGGANAAEPCSAVGKLHFICGTMNVEDLVQVPGTKWIIGSGFAGGGAKVGSLHLINTKTKKWTTLFPGKSPKEEFDKATYKDCPGAPDLTKFSAHGLNLREGKNGTDTLYAINHGGGERIDVFTVDPKGAEPTVTWVGCAMMPPHTWPNSVAGLPDGGFVVTDMFNPDDKNSPDEMNAGKNTGAVYEWQSTTGMKMVPNSEMSGNNGVEVSRDGKWIFVNAWGNKEVVRLSRDGKERSAVPAGFLVDNLRWAPNDMLMVAGQNVPASQVFACFASKSERCTQPWRVMELDPKTMKLTPVASEKGNQYFGDATVALEMGGDLYIGTFRGDRIAYFPMPTQTSSPPATGSSTPRSK